MEKDEVAIALSEMLSRLPEWVRTDLATKDAANRIRAEETLVAMAMAALFAEQGEKAA
jgi:hypothetical protein